MTTAISPYSQTPISFASCNWISDICQKIYDLALKFLKAISDCFTGKPMPLPATTTTMNSSLNLIGFYRGLEANNRGFALEQILRADDVFLERDHYFIQWLFPLTTPSGPNPTAPVLDQATMGTFRSDAQLRLQVMRSFHRMLAFYGLQMNDATRVITRAPNFNIRAAVWLTPADHNYHNFLRITRIIHSLCLLGHREYAQSFLATMIDIAANEGSRTVTQETLQYWNNAAR